MEIRALMEKIREY